MHLPAELVDGTALAVAGGLAVAAVGVSVWTMRRAPRRIAAAVVGGLALAAVHQADLPFGGGHLLGATHLLGGALAAIALGPAAAVVALAVALALRAALFHPDGFATLGADVLVLGAVGALGGYACYRVALHVAERWRDGGAPWRTAAAAVGGAAGVIASSVALTAIMVLAAGPGAVSSGTIDAEELRFMVSTHLVLAAVEAAVTAAAVALGLAWRGSRRRSLARAEALRRAHVLDGDMERLG